MWIVIVVVVVLVLLVVLGVAGFDKLRTSDVKAEEALGGINVRSPDVPTWCRTSSRPSRATRPTRRRCSRT